MKNPNNILLKIVFFTVLFGFPADVLFSQNAVITGVVRNGTTGEIISVEKVSLMGFNTGNMEEIAELNSVSEFSFEGLSPSRMAPYLVQGTYKGVKYNANVPIQNMDEEKQIELIVYETTSDASFIEVPAAQVFFRMSGTDLQILKMYRVVNRSEEQRTYVNSEGTFRFRIDPNSGGLDFVTVKTGTVPLNQTAFETEVNGIFAVDYPLRPGITEITASYTVPYTGQSYDFNENLLFDIGELYVGVIPANINISGIELVDLGVDSQRDMHIFSRAAMKKDENLAFSVSGGSSSQVMWKINRIAEYKWLFILIIAVLLISGVVFSRNKTQTTPGKSKNLGKKTISKKKMLLKSIAELDDRFAQKRIPENDYVTERNDLKKRLVDIYKQIEKIS